MGSTATQITETLWLGDIEDAKKWEGPLICVTETKPEGEPERAIHLPVLEIRVRKTTQAWDLPLAKDEQLTITLDSGEKFEVPLKKGSIVSVDVPATIVELKAPKARLDAVVGEIDKQIGVVLVHCAAGIERSPLVVAWYLHTKQKISLDDAYKLIIEKRPEVQRRDMWLEK